MKKILLLCLVFLLMLSLFSVTGQAEETVLPENADSTLSDTATLSEEDTERSLLDDFLQNAGNTLLSLGALCGSLLITFLYKTGTLSKMRTGMSAMETLLGKSQQITEECSLLVHDLEARMAVLENALAQSGESEASEDEPPKATEGTDPCSMTQSKEA